MLNKKSIRIKTSLIALSASLAAFGSLEAQSGPREIIKDGIPYQDLPDDQQPHCPEISKSDGRLSASGIELDNSGDDDVLDALGAIDASQARIDEGTLPLKPETIEDFRIPYRSTRPDRICRDVAARDDRGDLIHSRSYYPGTCYLTNYFIQTDEETRMAHLNPWRTYKSTDTETTSWERVRTRLITYNFKTEKYAVSKTSHDILFRIAERNLESRKLVEQCVSHANPSGSPNAYESSGKERGFEKRICGPDSSRKSLQDLMNEDASVICGKKAGAYALDVKIATVRTFDLIGQVPATRRPCARSSANALNWSGKDLRNYDACN